MWSPSRPGVATTTCAPCAQRLHLTADRVAAIDGDASGCSWRLPSGELLVHLDGELAGRAEDQRLHRAVARIESLDDRNAEGGGLPAAGLRLADDVASRDRNGMELAWIGVAMVYPSSATVFCMATLKASSSKLTGSGMMGAQGLIDRRRSAGRGLAASGLPNRAREDERKTIQSTPDWRVARLCKIALMPLHTASARSEPA